MFSLPFQVLEAGGEDPSGGRIIMVTDGKDDLGWLESTVPSLIADGIVVDTILLTDDATNAMKTLAERTGLYVTFLPVIIAKRAS